MAKELAAHVPAISPRFWHEKRRVHHSVQSSDFSRSLCNGHGAVGFARCVSRRLCVHKWCTSSVFSLGPLVCASPGGLSRVVDRVKNLKPRARNFWPRLFVFLDNDI